MLLEEQQWFYLTNNGKDKGVHTFPKGICPKVNVIARLEFELAYNDSAVRRFNHYTTRMRTCVRVCLKSFYVVVVVVVHLNFFHSI